MQHNGGAMAKILIAEDDRATLEIFSSAVESMGHSVIRATNGQMAWEVLQANEDIALLISDMSMPEMEGRELITDDSGVQPFFQTSHPCRFGRYQGQGNRTPARKGRHAFHGKAGAASGV